MYTMHDETPVSEYKVFLTDVFFTIAAFFVAILMRGMWQDQEIIDFYSHIFLIPLILFIIISFLSYFGAYKEPSGMSMIAYSWAIIRSLVLSVGILLSLLFFLKIEYVSRSVILIFAVTEIFILLSIRLILLQVYKKCSKKWKEQT